MANLLKKEQHRKGQRSMTWIDNKNYKYERDQMRVEIRSRQIETIQESITKMIRRYEQDFGNINASNKVRREVIKDLSKIKSLMNDIIIKERI